MIELHRNGKKIEWEWFKFPAGELHFKIKQLEMNGMDNMKEVWEIYSDFQTSDELMLVILLADYFGSAEKHLYMQYTPYARQDRKTSWNEPFSFKTFAKLINSCDFDSVNISNPHSDVTPALLDRCYIIAEEIPLNGIDIIISPDAGAAKKNEKIAIANKIPHVLATKQRDVLTGEITATKVHNDMPLEGKRLLIIDDICDGGRTFIELANVLMGHNPQEINLHVTVGLFTNGYEHVAKYFDNITTTYRRV